MNRPVCTLVLSIVLLVPAYANAQVSPVATEKITLFDTFESYKKGESLFVFGSLAQIVADSFVIIQVINPDGDLCQIQQLRPLSNGIFLTDTIPLEGRICGIAGEYEIKVFYGDDSSTAKFTLSSERALQKTDAEFFDSGLQVISQKIDAARNSASTGALDGFISRFDSIKSDPDSYRVSDLKELYTDLSVTDAARSDFDQIDPRYIPIIESALETTDKLVSSGEISFDAATKIDRDVFSAAFYSRIEDAKNASKMLNDVFVAITNSDPVKISTPRPLSYVEIEETLLNVMKKTKSILSRPVKEEVAFIFARGTGPLYTDELSKMIDLLTKARFLDVVLEKNDPLYNIVNTKWGSLRESLIGKMTMVELLEQKNRVNEIHEAALLLRHLDKVDRFITSESQENMQLAELLKLEWNNLRGILQQATSAEEILQSRQAIEDMRDVIEISSRISKIVEISRQNNLDQSIISKWEDLLSKVDNAGTLAEILLTISEFDGSIKSLREQRDPISDLKFQYESMKKKAELQADYENLVLINNALKIIDVAQSEQDGTSKIKSDRLEILLSWASLNAPQIKSKLDSYSAEDYKARASDILQRAQSIENLAEIGLRTKRFLPGYADFAESLKAKVNEARDLVIKNDLNAADAMVRELFAEWNQVSKAYEDDPHGSEVGYSIEELRKIEIRKKIDDLSYMSLIFYNQDFEAAEFSKITKKAYDQVDHGNYIDADSTIKEIRNFLVQQLPTKHPKIIFNISYDSENTIWVMQGYVDKPPFERRQTLYLTVYDMTGEVHSTLEFMDTKHGEIFTQWQAPAEPGLYVVTIQYKDATASQIANVPEKTEVVLRSGDLENIDLAREFEEYEGFLQRFGGLNYQTNFDKFSPVIFDIKSGLAEKNSNKVESKLAELERLIERYLPVRSRSAVIDVRVDSGITYISGAVQKTLSFSEDLFIDVYDKSGNHVEEIELKDSSSGHFSHALTKSLDPGLYVAQLQYHDLLVTDFFTIN